ncbi:MULTISPECIES: hypothetical protein [Robertmurraya]|uniref:Uncharacterized protein n=1 Tax=Robertmurraya beringensis TaxID=641660 RepID=A0ABV6KWN8_9BACI
MINRITKLTIFITILGLVIGNLVIATDSGEIWIEYSHRTINIVLGFFLLLISINALKNQKRKNSRFFAILSSLLYLLQLVNERLEFSTLEVTLNLLLLTSVIYLHYSTQEPKEVVNLNIIKKPSKILLIVIFVETLIGAFFKHSNISELFYSTTNNLGLVSNTLFSSTVNSLHGILAITILLIAAYILSLSISYNVYKTRSIYLIVTLLLTILFGVLPRLHEQNVFTSFMHLTLTTFTITICATITAKREGRD